MSDGLKRRMHRALDWFAETRFGGWLLGRLFAPTCNHPLCNKAAHGVDRDGVPYCRWHNGEMHDPHR